MKSLLDRYISRTLLFFTLLVVVAFVGVVFFVELVKEGGEVGQQQYGLLQALAYVGSQLPGEVYGFFPVIALLGSLLGLGHLAGHHELIVMRVSGVSLNRLIFSVVSTALLLVVMAGGVGEGIAPSLARWGAGQKVVAISGGQAVPMPGSKSQGAQGAQGAQVGGQGIWIRGQASLAPHFIHIGHVLDATHLRHITEYQFSSKNPQQLERVSYAENGRIEGGQWMLYNVRQSDIGSDGEVSGQLIRAQRVAERVSSLGFDPRLLLSVGASADQYTLPELHDYIAVHEVEQVAQSELGWYRFVFWKRIFQPLLTLMVILLAVPCMVGPLRSVTMGFRLLIGIVLGLSLYIINALLGSLSSIVDLSPVLGAGLPIGVLLLVSIGLISRWR